MKREILITGGKGFIGGHLQQLIPHALTYDLVDGQDILNWNQLVAAMEGIHTVVHLAALISVNSSLKNPGMYYSTNVAGTDNVLRAAIKAKCKKVIFASSAAVYSPDNPYGLSKKIGEDLMTEYKDKIQTINLRFFNIYGPKQNPEYAGVITRFFEFVKNKQPLKVTGDGEQTRDFISVYDITKIIIKMIEARNISSGSVFEIGTGSAVTINELAQIFSDKYNLPIYHVTNENIGIMHSAAKNKSLLKAIGEYKFIQLSEGLDDLAKTLL